VSLTPFLFAITQCGRNAKNHTRFLWVKCQIDALGHCLDYPRLRQALESLPTTLDETYAQTLERIPPEYSSQAATIFNLLIRSDWQFNINELVDAIATNLDEDPAFDPRNRMPEPRDILRLCSSLVTISPDGSDSGIATVQLAHFSVKGYLVSNRISKRFEFSSRETVARSHLARLCLRYIIGVSQITSRDHPMSSLDVEKISHEFPFVSYSARRWMDHAREVENEDENLSDLVLSFFLEEQEAFSLFASFYDDRPGQKRSPIFYAADGGLARTVLNLLDRGADVNAGDGQALCAASVRGNDTIARLLLDLGADVNAGDGAALQGALANRHDTTAQLLLDRGAIMQQEGHSTVTYSEFHDSGYSSRQTQPILDDHKDLDSQPIDDDIESVATVGIDIQSSAESLALSDFREAAAYEIAKAFIRDNEISKLYDEGLKRMPSSKFIQNHRRLLKLFYLEAAEDAEIESHHVVLRFLRSNIARIRVSAQIIEAKEPSNDEPEDRDQKRQQIDGLLTRADKERNTSEWTQVQQSEFTDQSLIHESFDSELPANDLDDEEDLDSNNEEEASLRMEDLPALIKLAAFLKDGRAFQIYRNNLQRFVHKKPPAPMAFKSALQANDLPAAIRLLVEEEDAVTQPESAFEWIREPLAMGALPYQVVEWIIEERDEAPWIRYDLPMLEAHQMDVTYHHPSCFHNPDHSKDSPDPNDPPSMLETISRIVSEMCGLGGVVPALKARHLWDGHVTFSDTTARVSYQDATSTGSDFEDAETAKKLLNRIQDALGRIITLSAWLQLHKLICDRFVIIKDTAGDTRVQAIGISFRLLAELKSNLEGLSTSLDMSTAHHSQTLSIKTSLEILGLVCDSDPGVDVMDPSVSLELALDSASLAVQVVCVGMLSFSQAHLGKLDPFFLMHSIEAIELNGIDGPLSSRLSLCLRLRELSCVGDMVGDSVMVFTRNEQPAAGRHDLLTSLDSLFELWGPGKMLLDLSSPTGRNVCGAVIGGGVMYQPSNDTSIFHWSHGAPQDAKLLTHGKRFGVGDLILIGALPVNRSCVFSQSCGDIPPRLDTRIEPHTLGTYGEFWTLQEMQTGLQAGQYLMAALNLTWVKKEARTLKYEIVESGWNLDTLEKPWGLLISVCTGVAQRVPLREVIAEVMPAMLEPMVPKPDGCEKLFLRHKVYEKLRDPTFRNWHLHDLNKSDRKAFNTIMDYVVKKICWTGVNRQGRLVVACPSRFEAYGCIRMPLEQNLLLASILKDSEQCATFACTTTRCIQTDGYMCRNTANPKYQDRAQILITSVCQYEPQGVNLLTRSTSVHEWRKSPQQGLQNGQRYWMGGNQGRLPAHVVRSPNSSTHVKLSRSLGRDRPKLLWVERMRGFSFIKLVETHPAIEHDAEEVFVLNSN
jgi:ankyrin repeat protein